MELGIPFSDPVADGPIIQEASVRALKSGVTPKKVLKCVMRIREDYDVPIVLLTYYNPIFRAGVGDFMKEAGKAGVDGLVIPDLPVDEADNLCKVAAKQKIDAILLATPTTSKSRLSQIIENSKGFLYLVSVTGVTGERDVLTNRTIRMVRDVCSHADGRIPVAVGFGISKAEHVSRLRDSGANGAIVGSTLVRIVSRASNVETQLTQATYNLKQASRIS